MGRTLDTLKLSDLRSFKSAPAPGSQEFMEWSLSPEEIPYIEVGGPGKQVETSPLLLPIAHGPREPKIQPPHIAPEKLKAIVPDLVETKPMTVAFEPWVVPIAASVGIAPEVIAYHQPEHAVSKQYAELIEKMLEGMAGVASNALVLTGVHPSVGTSTVLLNLAVAGSRTANRRLVIVDANLRRPSAANKMGVRPEAGLDDVLAGSAALETTIVKTLLPSLHLLPAQSKKKAGTLTSEALTWLMGRLRERYDVVLIDAPCLEDSAELAVLAPLCDGLYVVAPQGETTQHRGTAQTIARMGGRLRGLLHTHFEA